MNWSFYLMLQKPMCQALLFLMLTPVIILLLRPNTADRAWLIAVCAFVVFLILNAGLLWFDANPWRYFFYSVAFAVAYLFVIAVLMPGLLKVLRLEGSAESAMAFMFVIYHPVALLLVILVKWLVARSW